LPDNSQFTWPCIDLKLRVICGGISSRRAHQSRGSAASASRP